MQSHLKDYKIKFGVDSYSDKITCEINTRELVNTLISAVINEPAIPNINTTLFQDVDINNFKSSFHIVDNYEMNFKNSVTLILDKPFISSFVEDFNSRGDILIEGEKMLFGKEKSDYEDRFNKKCIYPILEKDEYNNKTTSTRFFLVITDKKDKNTCFSFSELSTNFDKDKKCINKKYKNNLEFLNCLGWDFYFLNKIPINKSQDVKEIIKESYKCEKTTEAKN